MGIGAARNDRHWHWLSEHLGGYNPLCTHLDDTFGVEFLLEDTGGGCHAIIGRLDNGYQVWLTMAICVISTHAEHAELEAAREPAGWAAGIYGPENDFSEAVGWAEDDRMSINDHTGVARLIRDALAHVPATDTAATQAISGPDTV